MSDLSEGVYEELATGILKANAASLFWEYRSSIDANQNFNELIKLLDVQIENLKERSNDQSGTNQSLTSHTRAKKMLEHHHQNGVIFSKEIVFQMSASGKSFSLQESSEERLRREMAFRRNLGEVDEELKKVTGSRSASRKEKKAAVEEATVKRNDLFMRSTLINRAAARTLRREGLSRELWGETIVEMFDREIAERRG